MRFFFLVVALMYVGRKAGWALSRSILYSARTRVVVMLCAAWGYLVALAMRGLIDYQRPGIILRWIMGYWLAAYVAIPNVGLLDESTIPVHVRPRHKLVATLSLWVFIVSSVCLAFVSGRMSALVLGVTVAALSFIVPSLLTQLALVIEQGQLARRCGRVLIKGSVIFLAWMILASVTWAALGLPSTFSDGPTPLMLAAQFLPLVVVVWFLGDKSWLNWPRLK